MYSKMAFANSILVFHRLRLSNSICMLDQNDSIMALSSPSPTDPNEGMSPASLILLVNAHDVNYLNGQLFLLVSAA